MKPALCVVLLLGPACLLPADDLGAGPPMTTGPGGSTTGANPTGTTTPTSTTSTTGTSTATSEATASTTTATSTGGAGFVEQPDAGGIDICDVYAQNCPSGHKCAWTATEGVSYWDSTTCVPLVPDPLPNGAACTYDLEHPFNGIDACGPAAACSEGYFNPGQWDGEGTCISLCLGSEIHPYCDPGAVCVGGRTFYVCVEMCDPFVQDCPYETRCDLYGNATLCQWDYPQEPRSEDGESCVESWSCELGSTCVDNAVLGCEAGCCTSFCDLGDPQAVCPLPGQKCQLPYDDYLMPPGAEKIGVCRLEAP